ncbi:hypothetical protein [Enterococcus avium]|uniref:hypothetical protein n=1 Tax=Enterococcus avium TaxID=33945 RepID=UPI001F588A89|nr:hypothetical protein [Enterococcus avium]
MIVGIIEKTEVETVLLLLTVLGLVVLLVSSQGYTGGIGFRGIAFLKYGKRIWQFSNRLFGGILTGTSLILYLFFKLSDISADKKVLIATIACFLCVLISDALTIIFKRRHKIG